MILLKMFEEIKHKYKISNLPDEYTVSRTTLHRKTPIIIKVKNIQSVYIKDRVFLYSVGWTTITWRLFIHKNFNKITKIETNKKEYYLKNGLLHNLNGFAYADGVILCWFKKGKEYPKKDILNMLREYKLNRILSFIN